MSLYAIKLVLPIMGLVQTFVEKYRQLCGEERSWL